MTMMFGLPYTVSAASEAEAEVAQSEKTKKAERYLAVIGFGF
jgi:hypothetical protein